MSLLLIYFNTCIILAEESQDPKPGPSVEEAMDTQQAEDDQPPPTKKSKKKKKKKHHKD